MESLPGRRHPHVLVAPFTGAWIEIEGTEIEETWWGQSHPSRVRGLKSHLDCIGPVVANVAPFTGAWIEIRNVNTTVYFYKRRTLHGCVD